MALTKVIGNGLGSVTQEGAATFNESGASVDFRVEGDTDANALVVDASGDRVGIGVAAPASKLEISAGVNSHGLLRLDDTDAGNLGGYMQFDSNGTNKANFQNANLMEANFTSSNMTNANFDGANLIGATWTNGETCGPNSIGVCNK